MTTNDRAITSVILRNKVHNIVQQLPNGHTRASSTTVRCPSPARSIMPCARLDWKRERATAFLAPDTTFVPRRRKGASQRSPACRLNDKCVLFRSVLHAQDPRRARQGPKLTMGQHRHIGAALHRTGSCLGVRLPQVPIALQVVPTTTASAAAPHRRRQHRCKHTKPQSLHHRTNARVSP